MTSAAMSNPRPPSPVVLIRCRAMCPKTTPVALIMNDETNAAMATGLVFLRAGPLPRYGGDGSLSEVREQGLRCATGGSFEQGGRRTMAPAMLFGLVLVGAGLFGLAISRPPGKARRNHADVVLRKRGHGSAAFQAAANPSAMPRGLDVIGYGLSRHHKKLKRIGNTERWYPCSRSAADPPFRRQRWPFQFRLSARLFETQYRTLRRRFTAPARRLTWSAFRA